ncbi:ABC transporter, partial [Escherichia coli]|nr:ABC transporter [Escherichia coli]
MADPQNASPSEPAQRKLSSLAMVWRYARHYPVQLGIALGALLVTSATTIYIPWTFKSVIDRGFSHGSDMAHVDRTFYLLFAVVL